ncbi:MAG: nitrilase-related carbon-nitrogen hydrolase [Actinomycetota bacterium]
MKIAALQYDIAWADREANFAHLETLITQAVSDGATFIVLPEMFSTGFVVDDPTIGEPTGGPSSTFLAAQATRHGVWIGGSCPELADDDTRPYNSFVVADPEGNQHRYRKIHPFTYGNEHHHFRPGSTHMTLNVSGLRVTLFVCYDLRFADEFWGLAPHTDVYVVPANWPLARQEHWLALLKARAIENQSYVVGCNRTGVGGGLSYGGASRIFSPLGEELASADELECFISADVSADRVREVRAKYPFLNDRRHASN